MENENNREGYGLTEEANQWYTNAINEAERIPQQIEEQQQQTSESPEEPSEPEQGGLGLVASETGAALAGGAAQAVESVGGFAELTGDTFKTGFNTLFGRPVDDSQNPFSSAYEANDAGWLDIPDEMVPENKTGLGKFARGMVEFGLLTAATGGVGGATVGGLRLGVRGLAFARSAGIGAKGVRQIRFLQRGAKIASEGAIADLVSSSSEAENLANLAQEHTPWMAPWVMNALAVEPEDNPWLARIKTVGSGAGFNLVAHGVSAFAKGSWAAHRARKAGKSVDEAEAIGNQAMRDELAEGSGKENATVKEVGDQNYKEGKGVRGTDPEENLGRRLDGYVNPAKYDMTENPVIPAGSAREAAAETINDMKAGGPGHTFTQIVTDSQLHTMTRGDKNLRAIVVKTAEDLAEKAFQKGGDLEGIGSLDYKDLVKVYLKQAVDMTSMIDEGGDIAANFSKYFKDRSKNARVYLNDGAEIVTGSPTEKAALNIVINSLAHRASAIANGTMFIADNVPINRQYDMTIDAMTVALTEHKKMGYMWGLDGQLQQLGSVPKEASDAAKAGLKQVDVEMEEFRNALKELGKQGRKQEVKDLLELNALTGGNIRTMEHVHDYLRKQLVGGKIDGKAIKGRLRQELQSTFYNSVLSGPRTIVKAVFGTNLVATLRPFQALLGASMRFNKKEMALASAQIDALGSAYAEGFRMFKYNWDLGLNRKTLSYEGKFDLEADLAEWQGLSQYYDKYGTAAEKVGYETLDRIVKMNTSPWFKYSQNAMGAGDALARTIIGRMEMRMRAARTALDKGVDPSDIKKFARSTEEEFRSQIFKKDKNNRFVVKDKAARMAGDEAAMTRALEENFKGFELISNIPGMKAFFPFVRTGFNALELTFQHTPLAVFRDRYQDIMNGKNLTKYGIRPEDLPQAQALMEGRIAMGSSIMGMATIAAMAGNMTGDYPYTKEDRDAWQAAGIQPYSFKLGDKYVSYQNIEPFNTLLSMTANVVQNSDILGEKMTDNMIKKLTFMTAAVLVDKSMLSGIESLADVMSSDTSEDALMRTGAKMARAHLPYAGLLGQVGDVMDANRKEAEEFTEILIRRDAFAKSSLPPKYDILSEDRSGKPLQFGAVNPLLRLFNAFSPVAIVEAKDDPIRQGLVEMRYNLPEMMSQYKGEPLNAQEQSELSKYMSMGDLRRRLKKVMVTDSTWKKGLDFYKEKNLTIQTGYKLYQQEFYQLVDQEFKAAKDLAMIQLRRENKDLNKRIELREVITSASKAGNQQLMQRLSTPQGRAEFLR